MKTAMIILFGIAGVCFFPYIGGFVISLCMALGEWWHDFVMKKGYKDPENIFNALSCIGALCLLAGCVVACAYMVDLDKKALAAARQQDIQERQQQEAQP